MTNDECELAHGLAGLSDLTATGGVAGDSPQTCHKLKTPMPDNGGFLRVSACGTLWQKTPKTP
ncbi:hypothetical protein NLY39_03665 [Pseudomonas sp. KHPS1]|nr:hypothetical protein [Pseudomonas sp. KHPS1]UTH37272.1 hypothetical protein NLY39_03665 [Pseudomonas sp. KHPS1]